MNTHQPKPWYKKWWVWLIIIVVLAGIGGAAGNKSNTDTTTNTSNDTSSTTNSNSDTSSSTDSSKATEITKEKMTISNSVATDKGYGMTQVDGEITNNDTVTHSASLKATFYDANGKIMGTASGAVNDVAAGETKTFSLVSTDTVTGYAEMKVQVDTLL